MIYVYAIFRDHPIIRGTETFQTWFARLEVVDSKNWTVSDIMVPARAAEPKSIAGTPLEAAIRAAMSEPVEWAMLQAAVDKQIEEVRSRSLLSAEPRPSVIDLGRAA